jgi:type I restriction enzyme S subunit
MEETLPRSDADTAAWPVTSIERAGIYATCGFLDDDEADRVQGIVSSTHVRDGRILSPRTGDRAPRNSPHNRVILRQGDLAVVLVRRVGDAAPVTAEHAGWTATRSVGIVRAAPHLAEWLRIWLQTPTARAWIDGEVTAHVEPTVSIRALREMLFPLPSKDAITAYQRVFGLIEELTAHHRDTARVVMETADALHADWAATLPSRKTHFLADVAKLRTGKGSERSLISQTAEPVLGVIAPSDLFDLAVPHLESFRLMGSADSGETYPPGTLMLSARPDGAHIAVTYRPASPLRSVVAVRPVQEQDRWWLLHELRSRSADITQRTQGRNSREISAAALKRQEVTWPDEFTRAEFHATVDPLHAVARNLVSKVATLQALRDALLRDISAKAGVLREPPTDPEEDGARASHPNSVPPSHVDWTSNASGCFQEASWAPE